VKQEAEMYQLACKDLGISNLDPTYTHIVTGSTVEEVLKKSSEHAKTAHSEMLKTMSSPQQIAEMEKLMRSKITQTA
jgi:predicted small metal-binding protein